MKGTGLVVNFWATWCAPCVEEMPALDRLDAALKEHGARVIAVEPADAAHVADIVTQQGGEEVGPLAGRDAALGQVGAIFARTLGEGT